MILRRALVCLTLVTLVGLAGCSDDGGGMMARHSRSTPAAGVSAADVRFMRAMVPMHRQAVRMSRLTTGAGASPATRALARRIRHSQVSQMRSIETCLAAWTASGAAGMTMMPGGTAYGMGPGMMSGMMSGSRMARLSRMHGMRFDRHFLSMMTAHHRAAVAAAEREIAHGSDPAARDLAERMADVQRAELRWMTRTAGR